MLERFFSNQYQGQGDIFENLDVWEDAKYRELQGTYPVLFLSFAGVKENQYDITVRRICDFLEDVYQQNDYLLNFTKLTEDDKKVFKNMAYNMSTQDASIALYKLSYYLFKHFGKKVIILMDEYDTPL